MSHDDSNYRPASRVKFAQNSGSYSPDVDEPLEARSSLVQQDDEEDDASMSLNDMINKNLLLTIDDLEKIEPAASTASVPFSYSKVNVPPRKSPTLRRTGRSSSAAGSIVEEISVMSRASSAASFLEQNVILDIDQLDNSTDVDVKPSRRRDQKRDLTPTPISARSFSFSHSRSQSQQSDREREREKRGKREEKERRKAEKERAKRKEKERESSHSHHKDKDRRKEEKRREKEKEKDSKSK